MGWRQIQLVSSLTLLISRVNRKKLTNMNFRYKYLVGFCANNPNCISNPRQCPSLSRWCGVLKSMHEKVMITQSVQIHDDVRSSSGAEKNVCTRRRQMKISLKRRVFFSLHKEYEKEVLTRHTHMVFLNYTNKRFLNFLLLCSRRQ